MAKRKQIFKVTFINQGKVYEVFARRVYQGEMYGFVVLEDLVFGEQTTLVVDPTEERLKTEFESVRRSLVPMHAIIRIDEVEREGVSKITDAGPNVAQFPTSYLPPGGGSRGGGGD